MRLVLLWIALGYTVASTTAFSHPLATLQTTSSTSRSSRRPLSVNSFSHFRGGEQEDTLQEVEVTEPVVTLTEQVVEIELDVQEQPLPVLQAKPTSPSAVASAALLPMAALTSFGKMYASSLQTNPILTKSVTAGFIFAMSDFLAQRLEKKPTTEKDKVVVKKNIAWARMLSSAAVGFLYFGPAAHYWYNWIFQILPGTSLVSTLQKAALGQMFFGPTFTCIFFATGLLQSGTFSFPNWFRKIRQDLPGAWLAGAGFWPLVDLVSFSVISQQWIPLFVNICSLFWTTYLVLKSYS